MDCYRCRLCGFTYDPLMGDFQHGISEKTSFEALPESWLCPKCGGPKNYFEKETQQKF